MSTSIQTLAKYLTCGDVVFGCYHVILKAVNEGTLHKYDLSNDIYGNAIQYMERCHAIKMLDSDDWIITEFGKDVLIRAANMEAAKHG